MGMVEYRPLELGARLMAGRLSLEQLVMVRIHCPQLPEMRRTARNPFIGVSCLKSECDNFPHCDSENLFFRSLQATASWGYT